MTAISNLLKYSPRFIQNYYNIQKCSYATSGYQFKHQKPIFYPDRRDDMHRVQEQQNTQLVTKEKVHLPKDYYYRILGLSKHATTQEIKAAYYTLAKRFHPDSPTSSSSQQVAKRFQEISNAYHILTDESTRLEYDQMGEVKDEKSFLDKANSKETGKEFKVNATNLLRVMGGQNRASVDNVKNQIPLASDDIRLMPNVDQKLEVTFLESVHGVKRNINLNYLKKCPQCKGTSQRMAGRITPEPCRKCNGSGQLIKKTSTYTSMTACDMCHGKRFVNRNQCDLCDCRGFIQETNKITIHVPAGVKTGDLISVENPSSNQRLSYRITVLESDYYRREGNDVLTEQYINITDAILGSTVKVRGIYETLDLKIDPGTESHTRLTLKGKGIKIRGDAAGDHIVMLKVRIPIDLTMKQRQLILAFAKTVQPIFA